jgi:adenylate cyclase
MTTATDRRLNTILAADVAGFSRLMESDEEATLATLKARLATLTSFIERHGGRVVNTAGDAVLAEFASVVRAVQCAAEIQRELGARNETLAPERRMAFRIGINLGDVIVEGSNLFGEGVNLAARLQTMAEPGGICIAGSVYEQVRNKLAVHFAFLGDQTFKNIGDRVPVYRIDLGATAPPATSTDAAPDDPPRPAPAPTADSVPVDRGLERRRFQRYLYTSAVVAAAVFVIDIVTDGKFSWFYWVWLGLAVGIAFRATRLFFPGTDEPRRRRRHRERYEERARRDS